MKEQMVLVVISKNSIWIEIHLKNQTKTWIFIYE
jgi:hypothetical protein